MDPSTDWLSLRMRDIDRYRVLKHVLDHHLTQRDGAAPLGLSPRQVRRLCQRIQTGLWTAKAPTPP